MSLQAARLDPSTHFQRRFSRLTDREWRGYFGRWRSYGPDGELTYDRRALRIFRFEDPDQKVLMHRNFYEEVFNMGETGPRAADGLRCAGPWRYEAAAREYQCNVALTEEEAAGGYFAGGRRMLSFGADASASIVPAMPPRFELFLYDEATGGGGSFIALYAGKPPPAAPAKDGDRPAGPAAPVAQEGELQRLVSIQEKLVAVANVEQPIDFDKLPDCTDDARLPEDPAAWVPAGWLGSSRALLPDADGHMRLSEPQAAFWTGPEFWGREGYRSIRLPDARYAVVPANALHPLPGGATVEYGGLMPGKTAFQRLLLRYGPEGSLVSMANDVFAPPS